MGIIRGEGSQLALRCYTCYSSQVKSADYLLWQIYQTYCEKNYTIFNTYKPKNKQLEVKFIKENHVYFS